MRRAHRPRLPLALLALPLLGACHTPLRPSDHDLGDQPERLDLGEGTLPELAERFHKELLRLRPEAGGYGVVLRHSTWNDPAGGNVQSRERALDGLRARVRRLPEELLSEDQRVDRTLLLSAIERERERLDLRLDHWRFDPRTEPHALAFAVASDLPVRTPMERQEFFRAWSACARTVEERVEHLRRSAELGLVAPASVIRRVAADLDEILAIAPVRSPFLEVCRGEGRWMEVAPGANIAALAAELYGDAREQSRLRRTNLHLQDGEHAARGTRILVPDEDDELSIEGRGRFVARTLGAVADELYPAFLRYRTVLLEELLPIAPDGNASPLARTIEGKAYYERLLRFHTTLDAEFASPAVLHDAALAWTDGLRHELTFLGSRAFATETWDDLRTELATRGLPPRDAVLDKLTSALARARQATPLTGPPPGVRLQHVEGAQTWSETLARRDRMGTLHFADDLPGWAAEAAAFRLGTPGAEWLRVQRGADRLGLERLLPEAVVDGWGLHALRLASAEGLYEGDWDRLGALAMEAAAAGRLLADTGLHALGWTREQARIALRETTLLGDSEVERAIDRILADPGRAGAAAAGRIAFHGQDVAADREFAGYLARTKPTRLDTIVRALRAGKLELPPAPDREAVTPFEAGFERD